MLGFVGSVSLFFDKCLLVADVEDETTEEICYVLLEEEKAVLSQELTTVIQNFAEELWIHILALILADLMLRKPSTDELHEQQWTYENKLTVQEHPIEESDRSCSSQSIDYCSDLDESSYSLSSDIVADKYALLHDDEDNEGTPIRRQLYMKQTVDGRMSPPLTLYEVYPTDSCLMDAPAASSENWELSKLEKSLEPSSTSVGITEQRQYSTESYQNEDLSSASSFISADEVAVEEDENTEVMRYIEQIIKEAEKDGCEEMTSGRILDSKDSASGSNLRQKSKSMNSLQYTQTTTTANKRSSSVPEVKHDESDAVQKKRFRPYPQIVVSTSEHGIPEQNFESSTLEEIFSLSSRRSGVREEAKEDDSQMMAVFDQEQMQQHHSEEFDGADKPYTIGADAVQNMVQVEKLIANEVSENVLPIRTESVGWREEEQQQAAESSESSTAGPDDTESNEVNRDMNDDLRQRNFEESMQTLAWEDGTNLILTWEELEHIANVNHLAEKSINYQLRNGNMNSGSKDTNFMSEGQEILLATKTNFSDKMAPTDLREEQLLADNQLEPTQLISSQNIEYKLTQEEVEYTTNVSRAAEESFMELVEDNSEAKEHQWNHAVRSMVVEQKQLSEESSATSGPDESSPDLETVSFSYDNMNIEVETRSNRNEKESDAENSEGKADISISDFSTSPYETSAVSSKVTGEAFGKEPESPTKLINGSIQRMKTHGLPVELEVSHAEKFVESEMVYDECPPDGRTVTSQQFVDEKDQSGKWSAASTSRDISGTRPTSPGNETVNLFAFESNNDVPLQAEANTLDLVSSAESITSEPDEEVISIFSDESKAVSTSKIISEAGDMQISIRERWEEQQAGMITSCSETDSRETSEIRIMMGSAIGHGLELRSDKMGQIAEAAKKADVERKQRMQDSEGEPHHDLSSVSSATSGPDQPLLADLNVATMMSIYDKVRRVKSLPNVIKVLETNFGFDDSFSDASDTLDDAGSSVMLNDEVSKEGQLTVEEAESANWKSEAIQKYDQRSAIYDPKYQLTEMKRIGRILLSSDESSSPTYYSKIMMIGSEETSNYANYGEQISVTDLVILDCIRNIVDAVAADEYGLTHIASVTPMADKSFTCLGSGLNDVNEVTDQPQLKKFLGVEAKSGRQHHAPGRQMSLVSSALAEPEITSDAEDNSSGELRVQAETVDSSKSVEDFGTVEDSEAVEEFNTSKIFKKVKKQSEATNAEQQLPVEESGFERFANHESPEAISEPIIELEVKDIPLPSLSVKKGTLSSVSTDFELNLLQEGILHPEGSDFGSVGMNESIIAAEEARENQESSTSGSDRIDTSNTSEKFDEIASDIKPSDTEKIEQDEFRNRIVKEEVRAEVSIVSRYASNVEEAEHITRISDMVEEVFPHPENLEKSKIESTATKDRSEENKLSVAELEHIDYISKLAEQEFQIPKFGANVPKSKKPSLFESTKNIYELTQEELEHIANVARLAEESFKKSEEPARISQRVRESYGELEQVKRDFEIKKEPSSERDQSVTSSGTSGPDEIPFTETDDEGAPFQIEQCEQAMDNTEYIDSRAVKGGKPHSSVGTKSILSSTVGLAEGEFSAVPLKTKQIKYEAKSLGAREMHPSVLLRSLDDIREITGNEELMDEQVSGKLSDEIQAPRKTTLHPESEMASEELPHDEDRSLPCNAYELKKQESQLQAASLQNTVGSVAVGVANKDYENLDEPPVRPRATADDQLEIKTGNLKQSVMMSRSTESLTSGPDEATSDASNTSDAMNSDAIPHDGANDERLPTEGQMLSGMELHIEGAEVQNSECVLNAEEIEHIARIERMAQEPYAFSQTLNKSKNVYVNRAEGKRLVSDSILSAAELEHIDYINKLAEQQFQVPKYGEALAESEKASKLNILKNEFELIREELEHISKVDHSARDLFKEFKVEQMEPMKTQLIDGLQTGLQRSWKEFEEKEKTFSESDQSVGGSETSGPDTTSLSETEEGEAPFQLESEDFVNPAKFKNSTDGEPVIAVVNEVTGIYGGGVVEPSSSSMVPLPARLQKAERPSPDDEACEIENLSTSDVNPALPFDFLNSIRKVADDTETMDEEIGDLLQARSCRIKVTSRGDDELQEKICEITVAQHPETEVTRKLAYHFSKERRCSEYELEEQESSADTQDTVGNEGFTAPSLGDEILKDSMLLFGTAAVADQMKIESADFRHPILLGKSTGFSTCEPAEIATGVSKPTKESQSDTILFDETNESERSPSKKQMIAEDIHEEHVVLDGSTRSSTSGPDEAVSDTSVATPNAMLYDRGSESSQEIAEKFYMEQSEARSDPELTAEEVEHIARIAKMAQEAFADPEALEKSKNESAVDISHTKGKPAMPDSKLSAAELEHIDYINKLAAQQFRVLEYNATLSESKRASEVDTLKSEFEQTKKLEHILNVGHFARDSFVEFMVEQREPTSQLVDELHAELQRNQKECEGEDYGIPQNEIKSGEVPFQIEKVDFANHTDAHNINGDAPTVASINEVIGPYGRTVDECVSSSKVSPSEWTSTTMHQKEGRLSTVDESCMFEDFEKSEVHPAVPSDFLNETDNVVLIDKQVDSAGLPDKIYESKEIQPPESKMEHEESQCSHFDDRNLPYGTYEKEKYELSSQAADTQETFGNAKVARPKDEILKGSPTRLGSATVGEQVKINASEFRHPVFMSGSVESSTSGPEHPDFNASQISMRIEAGAILYEETSEGGRSPLQEEITTEDIHVEQARMDESTESTTSGPDETISNASNVSDAVEPGMKSYKGTSEDERLLTEEQAATEKEHHMKQGEKRNDSEYALTTEEMEHIARIEKMAEETFAYLRMDKSENEFTAAADSFDMKLTVPDSKLSTAELEHIDHINKLAEQQFQVPEYGVAVAESEKASELNILKNEFKLIREELEHISKVDRSSRDSFKEFKAEQLESLKTELIDEQAELQRSWEKSVGEEKSFPESDQSVRGSETSGPETTPLSETEESEAPFQEVTEIYTGTANESVLFLAVSPPEWTSTTILQKAELSVDDENYKTANEINPALSSDFLNDIRKVADNTESMNREAVDNWLQDGILETTISLCPEPEMASEEPVPHYFGEEKSPRCSTRELEKQELSVGTQEMIENSEVTDANLEDVILEDSMLGSGTTAVADQMKIDGDFGHPVLVSESMGSSTSGPDVSDAVEPDKVLHDGRNEPPKGEMITAKERDVKRDGVHGDSEFALTAEEMEHIARIARMAEKEFAHPKTLEKLENISTASVKRVEAKQQEIYFSELPEHVAAALDQKEVPGLNVFGGELQLTQAEMEHIVNVASLAEKSFTNFEELESTKHYLTGQSQIESYWEKERFEEEKREIEERDQAGTSETSGSDEFTETKSREVSLEKGNVKYTSILKMEDNSSRPPEESNFDKERSTQFSTSELGEPEFYSEGAEFARVISEGLVVENSLQLGSVCIDDQFKIEGSDYRHPIEVEESMESSTSGPDETGSDVSVSSRMSKSKQTEEKPVTEDSLELAVLADKTIEEEQRAQQAGMSGASEKFALTAEELEHIAKVASMAEEAFAYPGISQGLEAQLTVNYGEKKNVAPDSKLSAAELERIDYVQKPTEQQTWVPVYRVYTPDSIKASVLNSLRNEYELSQEELQHAEHLVEESAVRDEELEFCRTQKIDELQVDFKYGGGDSEMVLETHRLTHPETGHSTTSSETSGEDEEVHFNEDDIKRLQSAQMPITANSENQTVSEDGGSALMVESRNITEGDIGWAMEGMKMVPLDLIKEKSVDIQNLAAEELNTTEMESKAHVVAETLIGVYEEAKELLQENKLAYEADHPSVEFDNARNVPIEVSQAETFERIADDHLLGVYEQGSGNFTPKSELKRHEHSIYPSDAGVNNVLETKDLLTGEVRKELSTGAVPIELLIEAGSEEPRIANAVTKPEIATDEYADLKTSESLMLSETTIGKVIGESENGGDVITTSMEGDESSESATSGPDRVCSSSAESTLDEPLAHDTTLTDEQFSVSFEELETIDYADKASDRKFEEMEDKFELTTQELEHIAAIARLAEQSFVQPETFGYSLNIVPDGEGRVAAEEFEKADYEGELANKVWLEQTGIRESNIQQRDVVTDLSSGFKLTQEKLDQTSDVPHLIEQSFMVPETELQISATQLPNDLRSKGQKQNRHSEAESDEQYLASSENEASIWSSSTTSGPENVLDGEEIVERHTDDFNDEDGNFPWNLPKVRSSALVEQLHAVESEMISDDKIIVSVADLDYEHTIFISEKKISKEIGDAKIVGLYQVTDENSPLLIPESDHLYSTVSDQPANSPVTAENDTLGFPKNTEDVEYETRCSWNVEELVVEDYEPEIVKLFPELEAEFLSHTSTDSTKGSELWKAEKYGISMGRIMEIDTKHTNTPNGENMLHLEETEIDTEEINDFSPRVEITSLTSATSGPDEAESNSMESLDTVLTPDKKEHITVVGEDMERIDSSKIAEPVEHDSESALTVEELEHIASIAARAEEAFRQPEVMKNLEIESTRAMVVIEEKHAQSESKVSTTELEHIDYISKLAEQEFRPEYGVATVPESRANALNNFKSEFELTSEELEHIANVTRMAEGVLGRPEDVPWKFVKNEPSMAIERRRVSDSGKLLGLKFWESRGDVSVLDPGIMESGEITITGKEHRLISFKNKTLVVNVVDQPLPLSVVATQEEEKLYISSTGSHSERRHSLLKGAKFVDDEKLSGRNFMHVWGESKEKVTEVSSKPEIPLAELSSSINNIGNDNPLPNAIGAVDKRESSVIQAEISSALLKNKEGISDFLLPETDSNASKVSNETTNHAMLGNGTNHDEGTRTNEETEQIGNIESKIQAGVESPKPFEKWDDSKFDLMEELERDPRLAEEFAGQQPGRNEKMEADLEFANFPENKREIFEMSEPVVPKETNYGNKADQKYSNRRRIGEQIEAQEGLSLSNLKFEYELTQEEIEHIANVARAAEETFLKLNADRMEEGKPCTLESTDARTLKEEQQNRLLKEMRSVESSSTSGFDGISSLRENFEVTLHPDDILKDDVDRDNCMKDEEIQKEETGSEYASEQKSSLVSTEYQCQTIGKEARITPETFQQSENRKEKLKAEAEGRRITFEATSPDDFVTPGVAKTRELFSQEVEFKVNEMSPGPLPNHDLFDLARSIPTNLFESEEKYDEFEQVVTSQRSEKENSAEPLIVEIIAHNDGTVNAENVLHDVITNPKSSGNLNELLAAIGSGSLASDADEQSQMRVNAVEGKEDARSSFSEPDRIISGSSSVSSDMKTEQDLLRDNWIQETEGLDRVVNDFINEVMEQSRLTMSVQQQGIQELEMNNFENKSKVAPLMEHRPSVSEACRSDNMDLTTNDVHPQAKEEWVDSGEIQKSSINSEGISRSVTNIASSDEISRNNRCSEKDGLRQIFPTDYLDLKVTNSEESANDDSLTRHALEYEQPLQYVFDGEMENGHHDFPPKVSGAIYQRENYEKLWPEGDANERKISEEIIEPVPFETNEVKLANAESSRKIISEEAEETTLFTSRPGNTVFDVLKTWDDDAALSAVLISGIDKSEYPFPEGSEETERASSFVQKATYDSEFHLTQEELEHIAAVAHLAEKSFAQSGRLMNKGPKMAEKLPFPVELEHTGSISKMSPEQWKGGAESECALTEEELEHIMNVTREAENLFADSMASGRLIVPGHVAYEPPFEELPSYETMDGRLPGECNVKQQSAMSNVDDTYTNTENKHEKRLAIAASSEADLLLRHQGEVCTEHHPEAEEFEIKMPAVDFSSIKKTNKYGNAYDKLPTDEEISAIGDANIGPDLPDQYVSYPRPTVNDEWTSEKQSLPIEAGDPSLTDVRSESETRSNSLPCSRSNASTSEDVLNHPARKTITETISLSEDTEESVGSSTAGPDETFSSASNSFDDVTPDAISSEERKRDKQITVTEKKTEGQPNEEVSEPKDSGFALTVEELEHIARIASMADEAFAQHDTLKTLHIKSTTAAHRDKEVSGLSDTKSTTELEDVGYISKLTDQDFGAKKDAQILSTEEMKTEEELNEEEALLPENSGFKLTVEELEHIARIANMAEEAFIQPTLKNLEIETIADVHRDEGKSTMLDDKLPAAEHIDYISKLAEKEFQVPEYSGSLQTSKKALIVDSIKSDFELTHEELEHIADVVRLAEESFKEFVAEKWEPTSIGQLVRQVQVENESDIVKEGRNELMPEKDLSTANSETSGPDDFTESDDGNISFQDTVSRSSIEDDGRAMSLKRIANEWSTAEKTGKFSTVVKAELGAVKMETDSLKEEIDLSIQKRTSSANESTVQEEMSLDKTPCVANEMISPVSHLGSSFEETVSSALLPETKMLSDAINYEAEDFKAAAFQEDVKIYEGSIDWQVDVCESTMERLHAEAKLTNTELSNCEADDGRTSPHSSSMSETEKLTGPASESVDGDNLDKLKRAGNEYPDLKDVSAIMPYENIAADGTETVEDNILFPTGESPETRASERDEAVFSDLKDSAALPYGTAVVHETETSEDKTELHVELEESSESTTSGPDETATSASSVFDEVALPEATLINVLNQVEQPREIDNALLHGTVTVSETEIGEGKIQFPVEREESSESTISGPDNTSGSVSSVSQEVFISEAMLTSILDQTEQPVTSEGLGTEFIGVGEQFELTKQELEHIAAVARLAEQSFTQPDSYSVNNLCTGSIVYEGKKGRSGEMEHTDSVGETVQYDLDSEQEAVVESDIQQQGLPISYNQTSDFELTGKEMEHIASIKRLAEESLRIPEDNVQILTDYAAAESSLVEGLWHYEELPEPAEMKSAAIAGMEYIPRMQSVDEAITMQSGRVVDENSMKSESGMWSEQEQTCEAGGSEPKVTLEDVASKTEMVFSMVHKDFKGAKSVEDQKVVDRKSKPAETGIRPEPSTDSFLLADKSFEVFTTAKDVLFSTEVPSIPDYEVAGFEESKTGVPHDMPDKEEPSLKVASSQNKLGDAVLQNYSSGAETEALQYNTDISGEIPPCGTAVVETTAAEIASERVDDHRDFVNLKKELTHPEERITFGSSEEALTYSSEGLIHAPLQLDLASFTKGIVSDVTEVSGLVIPTETVTSSDSSTSGPDEVNSFDKTASFDSVLVAQIAEPAAEQMDDYARSETVDKEVLVEHARVGTDSVIELTQEELEHIAVVAKLANETFSQPDSLQQMQTDLVASAGCSGEEQPEVNEKKIRGKEPGLGANKLGGEELSSRFELTQAELEHIAKVVQLAEQSFKQPGLLDSTKISHQSETVQDPVLRSKQSFEPLSPVKTEQTDYVSKMVQKNLNISATTLQSEWMLNSLKIDYELTEEELEHIANVTRLAEESLIGRESDGMEPSMRPLENGAFTGTETEQKPETSETEQKAEIFNAGRIQQYYDESESVQKHLSTTVSAASGPDADSGYKERSVEMEFKVLHRESENTSLDWQTEMEAERTINDDEFEAGKQKSEGRADEIRQLIKSSRFDLFEGLDMESKENMYHKEEHEDEFRTLEEQQETDEFRTDSFSSPDSLRIEHRFGRNKQLFEDESNRVSKTDYKFGEAPMDTMFVKDKVFWKYPVISLPSDGKMEFSSEHSSHYLNDGFNITSTVTYTDRLYKKMPRNLRFSERISQYGKANFLKTFNNESDYSTPISTHLEGMKPPLSRASSVFVVYTDQNLLASQTETTVTAVKGENRHRTPSTTTDSQQSSACPMISGSVAGTSGTAETPISDLSAQTTKSSKKQEVSQPPDDTPEKNVSEHSSAGNSNFSESLSFQSVFAKTGNGVGKGEDKSIRRSATWALKGAKYRGAYQVAPNVFERCERESIAGDGSMLHHADCLMRVNFFAERMTERIAELAGMDLMSRFKSELNPRAVYFSQMCNDLDLQYESGQATPSESGEEEAAESKNTHR